MGAPLDCNQLGKAGEYYVMYVLQKHGVECHRVDLHGVDLWCKREDGTMFTVEVKSAGQPMVKIDKRGRYPRDVYAFCLNNTVKADFTVFLALDLERFVVQTLEEVGSARSRQWRPSKFSEQAMADGISLLKGFFCGDDS